MIPFLAGLVIGGTVGVVVMSWLAMVKMADLQMKIALAEQALQDANPTALA